MNKSNLPKIRALMTATAKMTGRMVGIIMGGGTGAGTVVTTGTVVTAVTPGWPAVTASTPVTTPVPVVIPVCRSEAAGSSILERSERPGSSGEPGTGTRAARSSSRVT